ncbi:MAG: thioredoxin domain-containing protein [Bacteroidota bacterium]|nr:thioredoxin domain-containing protein [Bacteroidota bacterium]
MKKVFLTFILFVSLLIEMKAQTVEYVDAVKFKQLIATEDALLLDVRTPGEYSRGHIKGSTAIDITDPSFESKFRMLQKNKTILIYCLSGSRSNAGANYLAQMGFKKVYALQQGLMDWNRCGYELEQSSQVVAAIAKSFTEQSFGQMLKDNKLVLVDFNAVWCAPCKAMIPVIDKVSADFKGKAKVEKIDIEANKAITNAYQVQTIPGFVLFKDGKKVWSQSGIISYDDLAAVIKKYL